jgi:hypothetical protein
MLGAGRRLLQAVGMLRGYGVEVANIVYVPEKIVDNFDPVDELRLDFFEMMKRFYFSRIAAYSAGASFHFCRTLLANLRISRKSPIPKPKLIASMQTAFDDFTD